MIRRILLSNKEVTEIGRKVKQFIHLGPFPPGM